MFRNYLLTALRNLARNKLYSFINIGGLSIGLAVCLLIFLFVQNELTFDTWIKDHKQLYRIETTRHEGGQPTTQSAASPALMQAALLRHYPDEIEASTRVFPRFHWVKSEQIQKEETIALVDASFFDVFQLPVIEGSPVSVFRDHRSLAISETIARKYFGSSSPIGKTLNLENGEILATVVAVLKDMPSNTHLKLDMIMQLDEQRYDNRPFLMKWWLSSNVLTYVKMAEDINADRFESSLPAFLNQYAVASPGPGFEADLVPSEHITLELMPVADIHLHSKGSAQMKETGDLTTVYGFSGIALLILLTAIINFTNLSTARSTLRAREVSLRKVVGASRSQIIAQFLGETIITTAFALLIAVVIVEVTLPVFNEVMAELLTLGIMKDPTVQLGFAGLAVMIGCLAGMHPAILQSSFRPAAVLHSGRASTPGSTKVRNALTAIQFTIAIALMVGTAVIYTQVRHVQQMDIGLDKANKITMFHLTYQHVADVAEAMKARIEALPGVKAASFTSRSFPIRGRWSPPVTVDNIPTTTETLRLEHVPGDFELLEFFNAELIAGRFFSRAYRADLYTPPTDSGASGSQGGILNETAVRHLGFASAQDAVGKTIYIAESDGSKRATNIVGVVKDMRLRSARDVIDPVVFRVQEGPMWMLNVDIAPSMMDRTLEEIDAIWTEMAGDVPMDRKFIDERYNQFYETDQQRALIFAYFSGFAIFVACLGLYGLAAFTAEQRVKEIGIRKVLGANVTSIIRLLTFDFSKPVLAANVLAWPIAWYFTHNWLNGFQHRIELNFLYFGAAGLLALAIACLTVAGHAYRTARSNPVHALKHP